VLENTKLSHTEAVGGVPLFVTCDQRVGIILRLPPWDLEAADGVPLIEYLARVKPGVTLKLIARTTPLKVCPWETSRTDAIAKIGWNAPEFFIVIETAPRISTMFRVLTGLRKKETDFASELEWIKSAGDLASLQAIGAKVISETEIREFFPRTQSNMVNTRTGAETGTHHIGIIRLWRQQSTPVTRETLAILRERMISPYEIVVNIRKLTDVRTQYILQRKRGQLAASTDPLSARSFETAQEVAEETVLAGKDLVELEWLLVLKRRSEDLLKNDLDQACRVLAPLGDVMIEVEGVAGSYAATLPGAEIHHSFLELHDKAAYYLPTLIRGEPRPESPPPLRALPLHRRDGSLYYFDLFRKGYDGANCILNGRRGKGKSVLANLISSSLLADPEIRLIKVDVGGSYVKECELSGGKHVRFNLSEPSGLNPFALLSQIEQQEDAAIILAGFLSTLILESKETTLSKETQGAVERAVLAYANTSPANASLSNFLQMTPDFPRRALLERFGTNGVFANVLKNHGAARRDENRYIYFNFEQLQNASNEDFAQAVMAAVIATVNMEVLRAGDARRGAKNRVVFFADETPFFIQRNGRFFKLTTANFRKFGHGTVLIAQTTRDFALPKEDGTTDYGILINSPIRFFYQIDDEVAAFQERFGLTSEQITSIQNLGRTDKYREVFLQDELGGRVLQVSVTPEEYWRVTSSRADNEKLQALLHAVPGLTLQEAIRCLSV
jgi:hypothetical protein